MIPMKRHKGTALKWYSHASLEGERTSFSVHFLMDYNQATTKLALHSNETSKDKLSII